MTLLLEKRARGRAALALVLALSLVVGAACGSNGKDDGPRAAGPSGQVGPAGQSDSPAQGQTAPDAAEGNPAAVPGEAPGPADQATPAPGSTPATNPVAGSAGSAGARPAGGGVSPQPAPKAGAGATPAPSVAASPRPGPVPTPGNPANPGTPTAPTAGNRTGLTDTSIKIGCAYVQSGPVGPAARAWKQGGIAYFKYINDQGGINGRKIEFIGADTGFDPAKGLSATKKLVEVDKVFALCDPDYPSEFLIAPYAEEQRVPMVALGVAGDAIKNSKWLFAGTPSGRNMSGIPLRWAAETQHVKSLGLIYLDNDWGKTGFEYAKKVAAKYGMDIKVARSIDSDASGIESVVLAMRAANPDFILQITDPVPCLKAWAAAQQQQYKPPKGWVGTTCYLDSFAKYLGNWGTGFMGLANVEGPYAQATNPAVNTAITNIKKYFPDWDVFVYGVADWHLATIMVEAIKRAGRDLSREKVRDSWEQIQGFHTGLNPPNQPVSYGPGNHAAHDSERIVRIDEKQQWVPISDWIQDPNV